MPICINTVHSTTASNSIYGGNGTTSLVQTPSGVIYYFAPDNGSDLAYTKSSDNGLTWSLPAVIFTGSVTNLAVWYDRWSGINADLIHLAYTDSGVDDTRYRTLDAGNSDALSTETTIFAGTDTASGGVLSVTRSRGGNVYCYTVIDAGVEGGFFKLLSANVPNGAWEAALTNPEALAPTDQIILAPGFAADNHDIMAIFWDASANQISRYVYDDSANTWGESIFTGTFVDVPGTGGSYPSAPHFYAAVDLTNSQIVVLAWNGIDGASSDLTCWTVTESAITAKTDVVLNGTDDQGLCSLCLDTINGIWWAFYCGKSDGSETMLTAIRIYCKASKDGGATWGAETQITPTAFTLPWMATFPRMLASCPTPPPVAFADRTSGISWAKVAAHIAFPRARMIL